ncbi:MAG: hypothetical protein R2874_16305 [Desulfobacterales bacterium]
MVAVIKLAKIRAVAVATTGILGKTFSGKGRQNQQVMEWIISG